ncbi:MAG: hypothetical protein COX96_03025 [Candidatus Omnitrophica bacterium CG_4_10_14_0_2_um_filter_44_9]|nr:MAG: hypothetical protein COY78_07590 [Candidatus Omnitrophica bacterium CG_4_10_14_0_8_um_filter_44_12]PIZ84584.1 MAG: hypothetical protein COX96_03025 [Candidatus Omnitrophica bacterium CG_4_10_14_0_2_um_filter_44_9]
MIKFSLSSHHNKIRFILYVVLCLTLFVVSVNIVFSIVLNNIISDASRIIAGTNSFSFRARFVYFNVFKGFSIVGVKLTRGAQPLLVSKNIDIGLDVLSLLKRKALIKNISFGPTRVDMSRVSDLAELIAEVLPKMDKSIGFFPTTYFKAIDLYFGDIVRSDIQGYLSCVKGSLLITRGQFLLKKVSIPAFNDADFLKGSSFYKPFDLVFDVESDGGGFKISRLEFSNPSLKFTGNGHIADLGKDPSMDFEMNFMNIILDDFPSLNNESLQSRGVIDAVFKAFGTFGDLKTLLSLKVSNANFTFFDSLSIDSVSGSAVASRDHIVGQDFNLTVNGMPFSSDFAIYQADNPHVKLELSSASPKGAALPLIKGAVMPPAFVLDLSADWVDSGLSGDIRSKLRYSSKDAVNTLDVELKKFRLGYYENLFFNAGDIIVNLNVQSSEVNDKTKASNNGLSFEHVFSTIRRQKDGFILDGLKGICYGGTLEGQINFTPVDGRIAVNGEAHLRDVDLDEFFRRSPEVQRVLSGKLAGDLRFDTSKSDIFKGQAFVEHGVVEQNPLLNAVSDFLGVPSLKKIAFDDLSMFFSGGRGEYAAQVKLQSPDVIGVLDGKVTNYEKLDGYLSTSLSTKLLDESKQFRKILIYIKHDEPSVIFAFKISSYLNSPRVLWLKNEFKEKLQNLLPERNKRSLQRQVNSMVENMKTE